MIAVLITPREEEPQIDVTMANVIVPFAGASARDVEQLVSSPLEQKLAEIEGVKHVYSTSRPGLALLTVEYEVGIARQPAVVRLYNQVYSNLDWLPQGMGVGQPLIKPKGIDDVPIMSVTLWSDDPARGPADLAAVAHSLEVELKRVPGTRDVYTIGAPERRVVVTLDAARLTSYGLTVADLMGSLRAANVVQQLGERVTADGAVPTVAGQLPGQRRGRRGPGDRCHLADARCCCPTWQRSAMARTSPAATSGMACRMAVRARLPASRRRSPSQWPRSPAAMPRISPRPLPPACSSCAAS